MSDAEPVNCPNCNVPPTVEHVYWGIWEASCQLCMDGEYIDGEAVGSSIRGHGEGRTAAVEAWNLAVGEYVDDRDWVDPDLGETAETPAVTMRELVEGKR